MFRKGAVHVCASFAFLLLVSAVPGIAASATFLSLDLATAGNWAGIYGQDGYIIANDANNVPAYATVTSSGATPYTWASSSTDPRALLTGPTSSARIASTFYSGTSFSFDINLTDAQTHQLALYLLDIETNGRSETISILDAATNIVLNSQALSSFNSGIYARWNIQGHVIVRVTYSGGLNAVVGGLFFDPVSGVGSSPGTSATFISTDTTTKGNWKSVYGSAGSVIANDSNGAPTYAALSFSGSQTYTWAPSTTDGRALIKGASTTDRLASTYYSASGFTIDLNLADNQSHAVALYCLDYDGLGRSQTITIVNASTNAVLDGPRTVTNFIGGQYVLWNLQGHVQIRVTNSPGSTNAVLSGLFFGNSGTGSPNSPLTSAIFVSADTTTKGNWKGAYGSAGSVIANDSTNAPSYATTNFSGASGYTWAASTTDGRALIKGASTTDRVASTYYSPSGFTIDLNLTDNQSHAVALYCLDYDGLGRSQTITIVNASTNAVLDGPRTVTNFIGGQYLLWNLQGHVQIQVTSSSGSTNAVLSGLFFGTSPVTTSSSIQLPVEVVGPNGFTTAVSFNIPSNSNLTGANLWMQIHGLRFQQQASVKVNQGPWVQISSPTVTLLGNANAFGGIGGGFHTLSMTMPVPAGLLTTGTNQISFRFDQTDGRVSGFRVLAFNIQDTAGNKLLPPQTFTQEDPNTWQPPSQLQSDISAGQTLWHTAALTTPTTTGPVAIQATCAACHAQDGRDLKYFNYSNNSIINRSVYHGLTAQQGNQIASYIRSLSAPSPGRPWNPPYQPGPGLDSQPVQQWSAGAGLGAVLDNDAQVINALFPQGIQQSMFAAGGVMSSTGNLSAREAQIDFQLPDWNSWLPTVHPMDAFGGTFTNSLYAQRYQTIRSALVYGDSANYAAQKYLLGAWGGDFQNFRPLIIPAQSAAWTPQVIQDVYSAALWGTVKTWELNQEFGLEGMARSVFIQPLADSRAWYSGLPFQTSPNMLHIPSGAPGLDNGSPKTFQYLSMAWYHVQLILNNSNHAQIGTSPIDWGYVYNFITSMSGIDGPGGQTGLQYIWQTKALQISNNGIGPDKTNGTQWYWQINDPSLQIRQQPGAASIWNGVSSATRAALYNGSLRAFLDVVEKFTPQQFQAGGMNLAALPVLGGITAMNGSLEDRVYYSIPLFRYFGVNQGLVNEFASWAQSMWPAANWSLVTNDTCLPLTSGLVTCATQN